MKYFICSDIHLGEKRFYKTNNYMNAFELKGYEVFSEIMQKFNDSDAEKMIIAGDFFDSPNPSVISTEYAYKNIKSDKDIVILSGNHDYSKKNELQSVHSFNSIFSSMNNITCATYDWLSYEDREGNVVYYIPYSALNENTIKEISLDIKRKKINKSILVCHGSVGYDNELSDYIVPINFVKQFDYCIIGHNHLPFVDNYGDTMIITPGSSMPSSKNSGKDINKQQVYILDTETAKLDIIRLEKSPETKHINAKDVNKAIIDILNNDDNIDNTYYYISYDKSEAKLDQKLFIELFSKSFGVTATSSNVDNNIDTINKIDDFWGEVNAKVPEYYSEFKEVLQKIIY